MCQNDQIKEANAEQLESANGGFDLLGALSNIKRYEMFVCPKPGCHGKIVFDKHLLGNKKKYRMKCSTCGWTVEYTEGEDPKEAWQKASVNFKG